MRFVCRVSVFSAVFAVVALGQQRDPKPDPKKEPDQIRTRDVAKAVNFYSTEKEIARGKQLALAVARSASIVDDPVISEYVTRLAQNLARNSDAKFPLTPQGIRDEN